MQLEEFGEKSCIFLSFLRLRVLILEFLQAEIPFWSWTNSLCVAVVQVIECYA